MSKVLVYVELVDGVPTKASLELLSAARSLAAGDTVAAAVVTDAGAPAVAADFVHVVKTPDLGGYTAQSHIAGLKLVIEQIAPDLVLVPNSYVGLDLSASVAAALGWPMMTYCSAVSVADGAVAATCTLYGGKLEADVQALMPALLAITPGAFKSDAQSGAGEVIEHTLDVGDTGSMRVVATQETASSDIDIAQVERLICVGRGIGDEDNIDMARDLAAVLGAEVVASRPVVDLGWMEKSRQVGKSGKAVKPKLYIAVGVSGAPEHLEGMSEADLIIAVNSDPDAPIFDAAHYGTTCDALEFLAALTEKLQE